MDLWFQQLIPYAHKEQKLIADVLNRELQQIKERFKYMKITTFRKTCNETSAFEFFLAFTNKSKPVYQRCQLLTRRGGVKQKKDESGEGRGDYSRTAIISSQTF